MKKVLPILLLLFVSSIIASRQHLRHFFAGQTHSKNFEDPDRTAGSIAKSTPIQWITAYYTVWGTCDLPPEKINWGPFTHIIHQQIEPSMTGRLWQFPKALHEDDTAYFELGIGTGCSNLNVQEHLIRLGHEQGRKILLGLGGAGEGARALSFITNDQDRMQQYVRNVLGYAHAKGYDGVDLDWEFVTSRDRAGFTMLLRALRDSLDHWSPTGTLTVAVPGWYQRRFGYDCEVLNTTADQVNLMTYDLSSQWSKYSGFNAPMYKPSYEDYDGLDINSGVEDWLEQGLDRSKIGLGIPFFGYYWKENDEPGQHKGSDSVFQISYYQAICRYSPKRYHWDDIGEVPWLSGLDEGGSRYFISYEDTASVRHKIRYAQQKNLGGLMIFELWRGITPNAASQPLVEAIQSALKTESGPVKLPSPILLLPEADAKGIKRHELLQWRSVAGADQYQLEVVLGKSFPGKVVLTKQVISPHHPLPRLARRKTYSWRVRAMSGETKQGEWSEVRHFQSQ